MLSLSKMRTAKKVAVGFGISVVIAILVGWVGYQGIRELAGHVE
jgi:hypothetical protein